MRGRIVARIAMVGVLGAGAALAVRYRGLLDAAGLQQQLANLGAWAPLALLAVWLIAPLLFVPGGPITLAAGAIFGPVLGTLYSVVGATAGATLAFLVSRYVGGDWIERRAKGPLARLKAGVESEGWRFVAFVRLVPLFPFNLLNYALGLTRIPLRTYVVTSLLCMLPGTAGYAYLGYAGREAVLGAEGWVAKGSIALGVLAALALLPAMLLRWRAGKAVAPGVLAGWMRAGRDVLVLDVRSPEEYRGPLGHIEPSRLIPIAELDKRLDELEPFRDRPVVVV